MAQELGYKHVRQDLKALLEERNRQNAFLREQLVSRIERTAHLEARLLSTLDTLDELQAGATLDLRQAQRENARLVKNLDVCHAVARAADREKSDMSNAVLQLVAKVESCNDYARWPASRIEFSHDITLHPIRPAKSARIHSPGEGLEECSCARAYSPTVVEELSDSLVREKQAHALTVEEAERRIAALQSRVAARDAEIVRQTATCRCISTSLSSHTSSQLELLSEEERARIATQAAETNRVLESDIITLEEKLERERCSDKSAGQVEQSVQTDPSKSSRHPPPATHYRNVNVLVATASKDGYDAVPAALSALDSQIDQLRKGLMDLASEKEALRLALCNELDVQDPEVLLNPRMRQRAEQLESVHGLDAHRITNEERRGQEGFKDVLLLEEECIRLMRSEEALRSNVECLQHREVILSDENARLKEEISKLRTVEIPSADRPRPPSLPPLDTSAIDLAFPPLQPIAILPANASAQGNEFSLSNRTGSSSSASSVSSLATPTSLVDPSEVPLPITPTFDDADAELEVDDGAEADGHYETAAESLITPSPRESSPRPSDRPSSQASNRNAEAIARELADAVADTEMRDREIAEMRDLMADLASRVGGEFQGS